MSRRNGWTGSEEAVLFAAGQQLRSIRRAETTRRRDAFAMKTEIWSAPTHP